MSGAVLKESHVSNEQPGAWAPIRSGHWTGTWWVRRENQAALHGFDLLRSPAGRPTSFRSQEAALRAIAKLAPQPAPESAPF